MKLPTCNLHYKIMLISKLMAHLIEHLIVTDCQIEYVNVSLPYMKTLQICFLVTDIWNNCSWKKFVNFNAFSYTIPRVLRSFHENFIKYFTANQMTVDSFIVAGYYFFMEFVNIWFHGFVNLGIQSLLKICTFEFVVHMYLQNPWK